MNEKEFANQIVAQLQPLLLSNYQIRTGIPLLYAVTVDDKGNLRLGLDTEGIPKRGGGTGFEQDILIFEESTGQTGVVPRVSIEVKFNGVTTHDALVYSEKVRRIRNIYPYLRYGFLLGGLSTIPPRALRLGVEFDFISVIAAPPNNQEIKKLGALISREIEASCLLSKAFMGTVRAITLARHLDVCIESNFKIDFQSDNFEKVRIDKDLKLSTVPTPNSYYVYENWTAENKARIHVGECKFCNYGRGNHPESTQKNGRWLGPYGSYSEAQAFAEETGRTVSNCKSCDPQKVI